MNKLSAKQVKAISLIAQGFTRKEVAKEISVTPQTISEWNKSSAFVANLNKLKTEGLESARANLQSSANKAVSTLIDIVENSDVEESRRKAALDILRLCGFEPGKHEIYAWGIGGTTESKVEEEMNLANFDAFSLLKGYL